MPNPIFVNITLAIDERRLLLITDEIGPRLLEPHLIFESAEGDMLLHAWQQAGAFRHQPPPRWCDVYINDIATATVMTEHFPGPHRDYLPEHPRFHRVIYAIQPAIEHSTPQFSVRRRRERHGPPASRAGPIRRIRDRYL